jgi:uncharacterized protein (TIGR03083 family)
MSLDYTAHLRSDGEKMARAVAVDLDAHVPTCPAWNVAKLTIHTGQHHRWVADAIRKRGEVPDEPDKPGLRDDALVEWFRDGWRELADLLDTVADEDPAWTWSGDNRAGFWRRRTALETLVHRWDAENATGRPTPLDPALSADGIDEMLFVMMGDGVYTGPRFRIGVSASDVTRAWSVDVEDGQTPQAAVTTEPVSAGPGVVSVAGAAEDVLLFLWGRRGQEAVTLEGDDAARAALLAWLSE